jgi:hypothetical protein
MIYYINKEKEKLIKWTLLFKLLDSWDSHGKLDIDSQNEKGNLIDFYVFDIVITLQIELLLISTYYIST